VQGRIPVFVHAGAAGTRETVALARRAASIGVSGVAAVCRILDHGARLADFKAVPVERGVLRSAAVRAPQPPARDGRAFQAALCSLEMARAGAAPADGEAFRPRQITSR